jgi:DUF4097 and DUF4098 domain-containing protein YvlB
MAYGMAIETTAGVIDIKYLRSAKYIATLILTTTSGSVNVSGYQETATNGSNLCQLRANDGKVTPNFVFDDATKVLTWSPDNISQQFL